MSCPGLAARGAAHDLASKIKQNYSTISQALKTLSEQPLPEYKLPTKVLSLDRLDEDLDAEESASNGSHPAAVPDNADAAGTDDADAAVPDNANAAVPGNADAAVPDNANADDADADDADTDDADAAVPGDKQEIGTWHECQKRDDCRWCVDRCNNTTNLNGWSRFPMCVCICLRERTDRLEASTTEFHRVGLCGDIFYYRPTKPDLHSVTALGFERPGAFGSWESHRAVARRALNLDVFAQARARGDLPAIVVVEDDVQFLGDMTDNDLARIDQQVRGLPPDWDVLLLGHAPMPVPGTCRPANIFKADWSVWRVNSFMLHAYVLSENGARLLAGTPYHRYTSVDVLVWGRGQPPKEHFLDDWLRQSANMYAVVPMIAVQADLASDQNVSGKASGIRLHARLARHVPGFLETLFMVIPFAALVAILVVLFVFFLHLMQFCILPPNAVTKQKEPTVRE
jgi:hypothetical protein